MPSRSSPRKVRQPRPVPTPRVGKRPLPKVPSFPDEPDDEIFEDDELPSDEEPYLEPSDDSEVEESETGLRDEFAAEAPATEPTTESDDEIDGDSAGGPPSAGPNLTFFQEPGGAVGYVISEFMSQVAWLRLDGLARFLIQRADGASWHALMLTLSERGIPQAEYRAYLGPSIPFPKGELSEFLRTAIVSLEGRYVPAITMFRENVQRTNEGRERARALIESGMSREDAVKAIMQELVAPRTTVLGWMKCAEHALGQVPDDDSISKK